MSNRIVIYAPSNLGYKKITSRTIEEGTVLPKNYFYTEEEAVNEYDRRKKECEEERKHFENSFLFEAKEAEEKINQVLKNTGFDLDFCYDGDSQGIHSEKLYISKTIAGKYHHYFEYELK